MDCRNGFCTAEAGRCLLRTLRRKPQVPYAAGPWAGKTAFEIPIATQPSCWPGRHSARSAGGGGGVALTPPGRYSSNQPSVMAIATASSISNRLRRGVAAGYFSWVDRMRPHYRMHGRVPGRVRGHMRGQMRGHRRGRVRVHGHMHRRVHCGVHRRMHRHGRAGCWF